MAKNDAPVETLVVASKVKAAVREHGCNSSADLVEAINTLVHAQLQQAAKRAQANGRKTVRAHDVAI
jgi:histone H3/H4